MNGSTKCYHHGGKSSKIQKHNKHAIKPGSIYSQYLDDADKKNYDAALELQGVEHELATVRMQLARVLRDKQRAESSGLVDDMQINEETVRDVDGIMQVVEVKRKKRDYDGLIIRYTGRIETLEKTRKELLEKQGLDATVTILGGLPDNAAAMDDTASGVTIIEPQGL